MESAPRASDSYHDRITHPEKVPFSIVGRWRDVIRYKDGSSELGNSDGFEWKPNQIQNSFATLLAAWSRDEPGFERINFLALGTGLVGWDTTPPAQPFTQTTLQTEAFRKAITQPSIEFIDPITNISTGGVPSSKIEIGVVIGLGEANGLSLREFGLFGGEATIAFDSGSMVNWVTHARIDKDSSFEIDRTIRIEFVTQ